MLLNIVHKVLYNAELFSLFFEKKNADIPTELEVTMGTVVNHIMQSTRH